MRQTKCGGCFTVLVIGVNQAGFHRQNMWKSSLLNINKSIIVIFNKTFYEEMSRLLSFGFQTPREWNGSCTNVHVDIIAIILNPLNTDEHASLCNHKLH